MYDKRYRGHMVGLMRRGIAYDMLCSSGDIVLGNSFVIYNTE